MSPSDALNLLIKIVKILPHLLKIAAVQKALGKAVRDEGGDDGDIHSLLVDVAREEVKVRARRPPGMR